MKSRVMGCSQPRVVAAIATANRVAEVMDVTVGQEVGYKTDPDTVYTKGTTKLCFATEQILIIEAQNDPLLSKYAAIAVDEAHVRTLHVDMRTTTLRLAIAKRKERGDPLITVIMSATMQRALHMFKDHFFGATVVRIRHDPHNIATLNDNEDLDLSKKKMEKDSYYAGAFANVIRILKFEDNGQEGEPRPPQALPGGIPVFLPRREDIDCMEADIDNWMEHSGYPAENVALSKLYAGMPTEVQQRVIGAQPGRRKVVFATNVAEASLTVGGINHVVDCGRDVDK
ncbi:P-loop containing nucleoside triphosphate hydrolase protein [Fimicolochytrium jonesii]|uniref:P-loop containing nucleoside triphosphate hydrolase protein n=1 Tax=Fimicolochytrium jonesii TaxID=1396493 RepID=UPI0022FEA34B|nr:P-loop containing nucleoside triphosphate hydrolase protein [Fimicolochytrium jonesii]KAI8823989.1 P-loop containing nucleoside triphosphate hydrolase protein [Fimicolochytrium jonesii]